MSSPDPPRAGVAGWVVAALTMSNVVTHRWLPASVYVPWNLTLAAGLMGLARAGGHSLEDLGFDPSRLRHGTKLGITAALLVGGGYAVLLESGRHGGLLSDRRLTRLSTSGTVWRLLVHIPLGTALAEEVIFRGVLPLVLRHPRHPDWTPSVLASALFGLWHVLPAREEAAVNQVPAARRVAGTFVSTALAGVVLDRLRSRAGHIVAPVVLHFATNGLGLLAVRMAHTRR